MPFTPDQNDNSKPRQIRTLASFIGLGIAEPCHVAARIRRSCARPPIRTCAALQHLEAPAD
jgi:hypothetical protein